MIASLSKIVSMLHQYTLYWVTRNSHAIDSTVQPAPISNSLYIWRWHCAFLANNLSILFYYPLDFHVALSEKMPICNHFSRYFWHVIHIYTRYFLTHPKFAASNPYRTLYLYLLESSLILHNLFTPIFQLIQLHYNQQKESWPATIAKIKMKRGIFMASFNGRVIDGGLNLRSTCSTSSSSPIQIPNGTSIVVETVSGQHAWFATSYGGHDGYVVAEFVAISSDGGTCTVSTSSGSLNVRKTPSTSAAVLFTAAKNSTLRLLDIDSVNGWFRVSSSEGTGRA